MVIDTVLLREKFSQASKNYDDISFIQREIADELFHRLQPLNLERSVLDIGIGTGYLAKKIKLGYPHIRLYGLDLAGGMLEKSKLKIPDAGFIQSDAKYLPFKDKSFDLVISNLAYQWVGDLGLALKEGKRVLRNRGKFCFTIFSSNTFRELREVIFDLSESPSQNSQLRSIANLPDRPFLERILNEIGFQDIKMSIETKKEYYVDLLELLNWLKMIGANRYWSKSLYEGLSARNFLDTIANKYKQRFQEKGKIFATFEVIFVELVK